MVTMFVPSFMKIGQRVVRENIQSEVDSVVVS
jgi:hypothetical protein